MVGSERASGTAGCHGERPKLRQEKPPGSLLPAREHAGAAFGAAQTAADRRSLDGAALVGNADAETARPSQSAKPFRRAVDELEAVRQGVAAIELQACATGGKVDDLHIDRSRVGTEQEPSRTRDQPLRRDPKPPSFIGPVHGQLCDKIRGLYITL